MQAHVQHVRKAGQDGVAAAPKDNDIAVARRSTDNLVEHTHHDVAPRRPLDVKTLPEPRLLLVLDIEFGDAILAQHGTNEGFVHQVIAQRAGNALSQQIAAAAEFA